jgi:hypothetical protein
MVRGGRAEAPVPRSDVSFRLDQKTAHFKTAIASIPMQWSTTEEKQKNQLAQTEFCFIKIIIIVIRGDNYLSLSFASISALHCSKRRQTSRLPDKCSGVRPLKKRKRINLHKLSFAS